MNMKSIIWDWNGTLLDDTDLCVSVINQLLFKRNLPALTREKYREVFTFPVRDYYQAIGFDFTSEDFEIPAMEFTDLYNSRVDVCSLHQGALTILKHFKYAGYRQFVLSAMKTEMLVKTLKDQDIWNFFEDVAGLDDHYAVSKLQRGVELLQKHRLNAKNTMLVGDTLHDAEVASHLGIPCILAAHGHQSEERLRVNGNQVIRDLNMLKTTI